MLCVYYLHQPKKEAVNTKPKWRKFEISEKEGGVCPGTELQKTKQNEIRGPVRGGWD